jgi:hypothetical protein
MYYSLTMNYGNDKRLYLKVFLGGDSRLSNHQTNLIKKFAGRCPTPNLEDATEDPNIQSLEDY